MLSWSKVHNYTRATNNLRRVLFTHMADGRDNFSKGVSNLRTSVAVVFFVELGEFLQANTIKSSFAFQNILQVF